MVRRVLGIILCLLMIGAATSELYGQAVKKVFPIELRFEASYFTVDPIDDLNDTPYPDGIASWSPRGNTLIKLMLSASVRKFRFLPPTNVSFERPAHSRLISQDLFRLEEVYHI